MRAEAYKGDAESSEPTSEKKYVDIDKPSTVVLDDISNRETISEDNKMAENQQQNAQKNYVKLDDNAGTVQDTGDGDTGGDDGYDMSDEGIININPKFTRQLKQTVGVFRAFQQIAQPAPPSRIQAVIEERIGNVIAENLEKMFGGSSGTGTTIVRKSGFVIDVLNTAWAHGLGESMGARLPETIQTLGQTLGPKKTQEIVDTLQDRYIKPGSAGSDVSSGGGSDVGSGTVEAGGETDDEAEKQKIEKQKDYILTLKADNPDDVNQYAKAMGLSPDAAKFMLVRHQDDIRKQRGKQKESDTNINKNVESAAPAPENIPETGMSNDINQALGLILDKMNGMERQINGLQNKIVQMESVGVGVEAEVVTNETNKWDDDDDIVPFSVSPNVKVEGIKPEIGELFKEKVKGGIEKVPEFASAPEELESNDGELEENELEKVVEPDGSAHFKITEESLDKKKEGNSQESLSLIEKGQVGQIENQAEGQVEESQVDNNMNIEKKYVIKKKTSEMTENVNIMKADNSEEFYKKGGVWRKEKKLE